MTTKLNPFSMLLGAAALGAVLLTISAFQVPAGSSPTTRPWSQLGLSIDGPIQIEGIPAPSQMMRVVEGTPFTVPAGRVFVVTGIGSTNVSGQFSNHARVLIDSQVVWDALLGHPTTTSTTGVEVPPGLVALAGQVIEADGASPDKAIILGYLAEAVG